jgi:hypothetical protein
VTTLTCHPRDVNEVLALLDSDKIELRLGGGRHESELAYAGADVEHAARSRGSKKLCCTPSNTDRSPESGG